MLQEMYMNGTRVIMQHIGSDSRPIEPKTKDTVIPVDDIDMIYCDFDNGR